MNMNSSIQAFGIGTLAVHEMRIRYFMTQKHVHRDEIAHAKEAVHPGREEAKNAAPHTAQRTDLHFGKWLPHRDASSACAPSSSAPVTPELTPSAGGTM